MSVNVDEYDLREQEHQHRMKQAEIDRVTKVAVARASNRAEVTGWRIAGIVMVCIVTAVAAIIIAAIVTPNGKPKPDHEQQRETQCFDDGGGWVPKDLLQSGTGTSDHGMCVFPGSRVTTPKS